MLPGEADGDPDLVVPGGRLRGEVTFDDVSFSYGPGGPVLEHVSFTAAPGERYAPATIDRPRGSMTHMVICARRADVRPVSGTVANDGIDLDLRAGEIHAIGVMKRRKCTYGSRNARTSAEMPIPRPIVAPIMLPSANPAKTRFRLAMISAWSCPSLQRLNAFLNTTAGPGNSSGAKNDALTSCQTPSTIVTERM